jgi:multidrug efflux pump
VKAIDRRFDKLLHWYQGKLERSLRYTPVTAVLVLLVLGSIYFMYSSSKSELAPQEDQSLIIAQATSAPNATLQGKSLYDSQTFDIAKATVSPQHIFQIDAPGQGISGLVLPPRDQRKFGATDLQRQLQPKLGAIAGQKVAVFQPPSLPGAFGLPIQFAITTTESAARLNDVSQEFLAQAVKSGLFMFIDTDLKFDLPQAEIDIDRDKAAQLGLTMTQVGNALGSMLGGNYTNYFSMDTRSYKVIPQVERLSRLNVSELLNYPVANVPLERAPVAELSHRKHRRGADSALEHRDHSPGDRARNTQSLSTAELRHPVRGHVARRHPRRCAQVFTNTR